MNNEQQIEILKFYIDKLKEEINNNNLVIFHIENQISLLKIKELKAIGEKLSPKSEQNPQLNTKEKEANVSQMIQNSDQINESPNRHCDMHT